MKKFFLGFVFLFGFGVIITIVVFCGFFIGIFFILEFFRNKIKNLKTETEEFFSLLEDENDSIFAAEAERPHIELQKE